MEAVEPGFSFTIDGHEARLLTGGEERLAAVIELIGGANKRLQLLFYDMADDERGTMIRDALAAAAGKGVEVSMMIDGFGLIDLDDEDEFFAPIRDAGGDVNVFHPRFGRRYFLRNHQKLLVADHARCLVGGANLSHDYLSDDVDSCWRDLWLRLDGPQAGNLGDYFDAVFGWAHEKKQRMRDLSDIVARYSQTEGPLQWTFSAPWPRHTPWPSAVIRDLWNATRVDIVMAYFSPSKAMRRRIARAAMNGGKVRLVTPAKSDNNATIAAARFTYKWLLKRGVRIFEYQPCKLHTKLVIVDDVVFIGSSNFDFRSLYLNMELMLRIEDAGVADQFRRFVDHEIADSCEITPQLHRERATIWRRIGWALSHFLVTTMDYTVSRRLNFPLGAE